MKHPEKYYKGLDADTSNKRKQFFEANAKLDSKDPNAYKRAPGDDVKTKPSKYNKRFKKLYGDKLEQVKIKEEVSAFEKTLRKKAEATGIPYEILKEVANRGIAAWRTGHRPGAGPAEWALARVNSFATGGKTRRTADVDLWKKYKG